MELLPREEAEVEVVTAWCTSLGTLELTNTLGRVNNVTARGVFNDQVSLPVHAYQTNLGQP
jgi:hypothetical protein